jgi:predicted ATP-dependent endonuclease of OLD family
MLTGITLENFKAFKEPQFIPIKPITLVFGPNSAGKSSIMHALAFLKHVDATKGHCDPDSVEFGWEKIKLGSWQNLVHGHDASAVMKITLHWEKKALKWEFRKGPDGPFVESFEISENGKLVAKGMNRKTKGIYWSIELHSSHPAWDIFKKELFDRIDEQENLYTDSFNDEYVPSPEENLGMRDVKGERLQVIDPSAERWFKEGAGGQTKNASTDPFNRFSKYFDAWLGDTWRKLPLNNYSDTSFLTHLFPKIDHDINQETPDVFDLPRKKEIIDHDVHHDVPF